MPDHHYTGLTAHKMGEIVRERGDLHAAMFVFPFSLRPFSVARSF